MSGPGKIEAVGGGVYRCALTSTVAFVAGSASFRIGLADAGGNPVFGAAGTESVLVWGAQPEPSDAASSYIPTTTGPATRNADVVMVPLASVPGWSGSEGALFVEARRPRFGDVDYPELAQLDDGTTSNRVSIFVATSYAGIRGGASVNGVSLADFGSRTATTGVPFRAALTYGGGSMALAAHGLLAETVPVGTTPSVTRLQIGGNALLARSWNGHIRRLALFNKRLSDAQLQTLTSGGEELSNVVAYFDFA